MNKELKPINFTAFNNLYHRHFGGALPEHLIENEALYQSYFEVAVHRQNLLGAIGAGALFLVVILAFFLGFLPSTSYWTYVPWILLAVGVLSGIVFVAITRGIRRRRVELRHEEIKQFRKREGEFVSILTDPICTIGLDMITDPESLMLAIESEAKLIANRIKKSAPATGEDLITDPAQESREFLELLVGFMRKMRFYGDEKAERIYQRLFEQV
jgi:hypothetical protein